jgi:erythromycin esterase-like protein
MQTTNSSTQLLRLALHPLQGGSAGLDPLIDLAGDSGFVLLGEATHGTHEFYATRAAITQRLIAEKGFQAVAVEADWPDAHRINEYVLGHGNDPTAGRALSGFTRFPVWMWRNRDVENICGVAPPIRGVAPPIQ